MVSLPRRRTLQPNDVPLKLGIVPWVVEIGAERHRFDLLSQFHFWLRENPTHDHIKIRRNGSAIYDGPWPSL